MKLIDILSGVFVFLTAAVVFADDLPVITVLEGSNRVALSVVNKWDNELVHVSAKVDNNSLPVWLTVRSAPQVIDVRSGESSSDRLYLFFEVTGATDGAEAQVPLMLIDSQGNRWSYAATVRVASGAPLAYALYDNFPNPFNPSTTIRYSLKEAQHTKLTVFNSLGQKIRTIVDEPQAAGIHTIQWNGRNNSGEQVSSGVYFYKLEAGNFVQTKRMMIVE